MEGMLRERSYRDRAAFYMVNFSREPGGWTWKTSRPCGSASFLSAPLRHATIEDAVAHVERSLDNFEGTAGAWCGAGVRIWDDRDCARPWQEVA